MNTQFIHTPNAPKPIGPYSQAIVFNNLVFLSGQIGIDQDGNLPPDVMSQTHQVMKNLESILEAASSSFDSVLKTTIFLTDLNNFQKVNEIYGSYFHGTFPARSTISVSSLPRGALVEIDMIATQI